MDSYTRSQMQKRICKTESALAESEKLLSGAQDTLKKKNEENVKLFNTIKSVTKELEQANAELSRVREANKKMCSYDYIDKVERELTEARDEMARVRDDVRRFCTACDGQGDKTMCEECPGPLVLDPEGRR